MPEHAFIPFALPDIGDREVEAVAEAMRTGWVTTGPKVREFEEKFAAAISPDVIAVAVNSATSGLHLALEALGIGPGDEVLVPTWTFTATAEVVRYLGANPVLVDVERDTLNVDLADAAEKVTSRTRAIMPVHFAGHPVDPSALADFARSADLAVVEDAAHAFPAAAGGRPVGGHGSAATVYSFYATKTITTGEGGMVLTTDPALAARMRTMRLHGISRDVFDRYRSSSKGSWRYEVVAPGFKYNLPDPAAAMGLVQLERAVEMRDRRAAIAHHYLENLSDLSLSLPLNPSDDVEHAWHLFVVRTPVGADRDDFIEAMTAAGVGTSVHFIPLHLHPYWRDLTGVTPDQLPVASAEFERVVSLPIYPSMTDEHVERVVDAVREVMR